MVLGNIPRTQTFHSLNRYREALRIPSFLILAIEAPIYFANTTYLQERSVHMFALTILSKPYYVWPSFEGNSTGMSSIFLLGLSDL